jgi:hypothetical protein
MEDLRIQVVELRGASGLGVFLRVEDEQRVFRVAPVRDPRQPRFWCLAAYECSACGIPITGDAIWAGWWGSAPSELPRLIEKIRANASLWLHEAQCTELRRILAESRRTRPTAYLANSNFEEAELAS